MLSTIVHKGTDIDIVMEAVLAYFNDLEKLDPTTEFVDMQIVQTYNYTNITLNPVHTVILIYSYKNTDDKSGKEDKAQWPKYITPPSILPVST